MSAVNKTNTPATEEDLKNIEINGMRILIEEKEKGKNNIRVADAGKVTNMPEMDEYDIIRVDEKER